MRIIDPKTTPTRDLHQFLLGVVSPRPIAWVSTIDENGNNNVAPYSFFNAFSSNPPMLVFSSNRRVVDNTTKDTLANIEANMECVVHAVNYENVRKMTITSIQYDTGISEFEKAGLTPVDSDLVAPKRIAEAPAAMECKVKEIITLGDQGGAGHLILCEVVRMHIDENVIDENNRIDPHKIDLMGRLGRAYYVRVKGENVFPIIQAVTEITIGYDNLPKGIQKSQVFSANNIAQLAGIKEAPSEAQLAAARADHRVKSILEGGDLESLHAYSKEILDADDLRRMEAAAIAWLGN